MTSFGFILGVVPLYIASGVSSASQRAIGTTVFWGMLIGTVLAVFFVPLFFVVVRKLFKDSPRQMERAKLHAAAAGMTPELVDKYVADAEEGAELSEEEKRALHENKD